MINDKRMLKGRKTEMTKECKGKENSLVLFVNVDFFIVWNRKRNAA